MEPPISLATTEAPSRALHDLRQESLVERPAMPGMLPQALSPGGVMDLFEARLLDLEDAIVTAWKRSGSDSVLGELAALAGATRALYQELKQQSEGMTEGHRPSNPGSPLEHWSFEWRRKYSP